MPAKSEKQRKFFGAVMGAKKGKGSKVKGAAKKVAKEMPEKEIKKFLKKESYDDLVNEYLKTYLLEMDVRQDPREGFDGDPFVDPTEDMGEGEIEAEDEEVSMEEMYRVVAQAVGEQKASMMSGQEVRETYYYIQKDPSMGQDEDYEEECESAKQGCKCGGCPACGGGEQGNAMLTFYGLGQ